MTAAVEESAIRKVYLRLLPIAALTMRGDLQGSRGTSRTCGLACCRGHPAAEQTQTMLPALSSGRRSKARIPVGPMHPAPPRAVPPARCRPRGRIRSVTLARSLRIRQRTRKILSHQAAAVS